MQFEQQSNDQVPFLDISINQQWIYRNDCLFENQRSNYTFELHEENAVRLTFTWIRKKSTFIKPKAILPNPLLKGELRKAILSLPPILCLVSTTDQFQEGISKISDLAGVKSLAFRTIIVESVECNADTRKRRRYLGFLGFCARSKSFGSNLQFLTRDGRGR